MSKPTEITQIKIRYFVIYRNCFSYHFYLLLSQQMRTTDNIHTNICRKILQCEIYVFGVLISLRFIGPFNIFYVILTFTLCDARFLNFKTLKGIIKNRS